MKSIRLIRKFAVGIAFGLALAIAPAAAHAGIFISVGFAPPALPVYTQPICPGDGYLWNPGYWAYGPEGYYWVPGVWVQPPTVGLLWTPGYWGWGNGAYIFHEGYWGPHVGFYGGINYGFGFGGSGFYGGEWRGGHFAYNSAYSNVNTTVIHNTYINRTVVNNTTINNSHTSFNGGTGGVAARPTAEEARFEHESHVPPTSAQMSHVQAAHAVPANFAKANGGHPQLAAIQRPGAMNTAVPARGFNGAAANQHANNDHTTAQQLNQRQNTTAPRPATRAGGFGQTAQRPVQTQARSEAPAHPVAQQQAHAAVQPHQQAAPRTQAAPRQQAAPHPEGHPEGNHPHR